MLTIADFKVPTGELVSGVFTGTSPDLDTCLTSWLNTATDLASVLNDSESRDEAVKAYVYWKAYAMLVQTLSSIPSSQTLDGGRTSVAYSASQIAEFRSRENYYKALWDAVMPGEQEADIQRRSRRSASTKVKWF